MSVNELQLTHVPRVKVGMLIRKPPAEVFRAFVDPDVTTRFWFTKSSGEVVTGASLTWDWEMYGLSQEVSVKEVQADRLIRFEWGPKGTATTIEFRFVPWRGDTTYVQVTESGLGGTGDEMVAHVADSAGGFSFVLAAAKALLEHDTVLTLVADHVPEGLEL